MSSPLPSARLSLFHNPAAAGSRSYGPVEEAVLDEAGFTTAKRDISSWPGYAPSPLTRLPGLAAAAGLEAIFYKDESGRFGLGSFKALGGAYAVSRLLIGEIEAATGETVTTTDLLAGTHREITSKITVTSATDGNHGRSVAWGARMFGCACVIYIHATVSEGRKRAIERFGASVVRVPGNYDDSVRQAAADAETEGRFVVSDTSYDGYTDLPRDVMQGYAVMAGEIVAQLADDEHPTHVFVQGGVGGLAAAVCAVLWRTWGSERPRFIVVEPENAACLFETARNGQPTTIEGDLDTVMAGLAAGEVSLIAWQVLRGGADDFVTLSDRAAEDTMRLLADGVDDDPPVVAGESAVAGLAAALAARRDPVQAEALGLAADSRILVIGSEGDTDAEVYERIVGRSAAEVRSG